MPAVAATESWKPVERTRKGSTSTSPVMARARRWTPVVGRPHAVATAAAAAMATARRTDGSNRVTVANRASSTATAASRAGRAGSAQDRCGHGQDEGHVLTGDGQEVGEPRAPEVVGQLGGLVAVVAEHQPHEQRPAILAHHLGPVAQGAAEVVGRPPRGAAAGGPGERR